MSHPKGAYLGGVRCLQTLMARCYVCADTGCWQWRLAVSQGSPRVHIYMDGGSSRVMRGRRAALFLARGRDLPRGHLAFAARGCADDACVNPAHARSGSKAAWGAAMSARGVFATPARIESARRQGKAKAKLSREQIEQIVASDAPARVFAQAFGVAINTVARKRRDARSLDVVWRASG